MIDKDFLKLIGRRIIDRERAIGIDLGLKDEERDALLRGEYPITYKWIEEVAGKLHVEPLRLLSINYKSLTVPLRNADAGFLSLLKQVEEVIHVLIANDLLGKCEIVDLSDEYEGVENLVKKLRKEYGLGDNLFEFCFKKNFYPLVIQSNLTQGALIMLEDYAIALISDTPRRHWELAKLLGRLVMRKRDPDETTINHFASEIMKEVCDDCPFKDYTLNKVIEENRSLFKGELREILLKFSYVDKRP